MIAVAGVVTPLVIQHRSQAALREENQALRQQASQLAQATAENERLSNLVTQAKSAESLPGEQMSELLRLREEVSWLRQEGAELKRLQGQDRCESALRIEGRSLAGSPGQRPPSRVRISRMACTSSLSFSRHESCFISGEGGQQLFEAGNSLPRLGRRLHANVS